MGMGGLFVKVECIAIVKDYASADVRAQRVAVDAFTRLGVETEQFHVLEDAKLFDIYRGEKLGSERKSVAFAITLRAADRTLTDEEINAVMEKMLKALNTQFGAELRA